MSTLDIDNALVIASALEDQYEAIRLYPPMGYEPNPIQEAFHRATHTVRVLCPGNGLGKTTAAWMEAALWIMHWSRFRPVPKESVEIILFVQEYGQFEKMKMLLEGRHLPTGWTWHEQKHYYEWQAGDRLYIESCEKSWKVSQGTNPHLVIFDEVPPFAIWNEMRMCKRGERETEFAFAATATDADVDWMVKLFWEPWVESHKKAGVSIGEAQRVQAHPDVWLWHEGGIDDNPHTSQKQKDWFHAQKFASEEERKVRLRGGFARFNRRPVFDQEALRTLEVLIGEWDKARGPGTSVGVCLKEAA